MRELKKKKEEESLLNLNEGDLVVNRWGLTRERKFGEAGVNEEIPVFFEAEEMR